MQVSYEKQLGLKANKEYEDMTDQAIINILNYFSKKYPGVVIEVPKAREKSPKSILSKIKNLQIERLSKLYAIEGISQEEKQEIYNLFKERVYEKTMPNQENMLLSMKNIIYKPIEEINIDEDVNNIMVKDLSTSTKTALLRMLVSKIEKSNLANRAELLDMLDTKYGKKAAHISKIPEDDIIRYSSIEDIRNTKRRMNVLHDEQYYLRSKDLRGMKIIIIDFKDNFKTENETLKKLLEKKREATTAEKRTMYNNRCSIELGKEFMKDLSNNQELLQQWGIKVLPYSVKYKKKTNGYEANHMKFEFLKNRDYSFEIQIKSEYIEELSNTNGSAAHQSRPGKERIFPSIENKQKFIQGLEFTLPKYTTYEKTETGYVRHKCNMQENMVSYYQSQIGIGTEGYEKALQIIEETEKEAKTI